MAKKSKSNQSSTLGLFALFIIIAAIALTVILVQKQQNVQQHAQVVSGPRVCGFYGDVDGFDSITNFDVDKILKLITAGPTGFNTHIQKRRAHVTWDGLSQTAESVTAKDALALQKYLSKGDTSMFSACKFTRPIKANCPVGDVDSDGSITNLDSYTILNSTTLGIDLPPLSIADVNNDGRINSIDALLIERYRRGLLKTFPRKCS